MPLPNKSLSPQDRAVCRRVGYIRKEIAKWSQPDLARELGITQNQLAGIEYERAPLRFWWGDLLCRRFNISQRWLARGELPQSPYWEIDPLEIERSVKPNAGFLWVFDRFLDADTQELTQAVKDWVGNNAFLSGNYEDSILANIHRAGQPRSKAMAFYIAKLILLRLHSLPDPLKTHYGRALLEAERQFQKRYTSQIEKLLAACPGESKGNTSGPARIEAAANNLGKEGLDIQPYTPDTAGVKRKIHSLPDLMAAVRERTKFRGQKAALARELGVTRQAIDQWLSGNAKPSAETTFELLKRVE